MISLSGMGLGLVRYRFRLERLLLVDAPYRLLNLAVLAGLARSFLFVMPQFPTARGW